MNDAPLAAGQLLEGKYQIVGVVGEGAWGQVLEGINVRIQRKVAIKILKAEYASNAQMVSRFEREALASTHIESPHVVQVFDAGVLADGRPYLVMEFLTGEDLSARIASVGTKGLPIVTAVDLCAQVARGLTAAHAEGIFHRDMKPSNVVIAKTKSGREVAKIVDFGISKLLDATKEQVSNTQTGTILGSPVYMSPEQARGSKTTDHRSDIYSLGVVLFECLTGVTPHNADSFNELLFKIVLEPAPSVRTVRPEIDGDLDAILQRTLAKAPELRVQTAAELESLLSGWLTKHGVKVSDSTTESGSRLHAKLRESPVITGDPESSGRLAVHLPNNPQLQATVPLAQQGPSEAMVALVQSERGAVSIASIVGSGSLDSSLTPSSSTSRAKGLSNRRGYAIAGAAALLALVGIVAVTSKGGEAPKVAGSGAPTTEPAPSSTTVAVTASASAKTTDPSAATTASATASAATATTAAGATTVAGAEAGVSPDAHVVGARPGSGGARPKPVASSGVMSATPQPAASGTVPASVGGRTIRTDL